jgi:hypothetical protein
MDKSPGRDKFEYSGSAYKADIKPQYIKPGEVGEEYSEVIEALKRRENQQAILEYQEKMRQEKLARLCRI